MAIIRRVLQSSLHSSIGPLHAPQRSTSQLIEIVLFSKLISQPERTRTSIIQFRKLLPHPLGYRLEILDLLGARDRHTLVLPLWCRMGASVPALYARPNPKNPDLNNLLSFSAYKILRQVYSAKRSTYNV